MDLSTSRFPPRAAAPHSAASTYTVALPSRPQSHRERIPVTTIQRTIDDLDGTIAPHLFRRAKRQAELMNVRLRGTTGRRARSDLEEDFFALVQRHHLPQPETNVKIGHHEVDFLWREQRVIVETDSFAYHRGSVSFEDDYARDLDLRQAGYTVLRFNDQQIDDEPGRVLAVLAAALTPRRRQAKAAAVRPSK